MYVLCDTLYKLYMKNGMLDIITKTFPNMIKDEIGGLTNENVNADCIQPVAEFLERKVNEWLQAKSIELKLTVNNDSFTGYFNFMIPYRSYRELLLTIRAIWMVILYCYVCMYVCMCVCVCIRIYCVDLIISLVFSTVYID